MNKISLLGGTENRVDFLNRRELKSLSKKISDEIANAPKGTLFYFDMSEVSSVNSSGIDEIIGKSIRWMKENRKTEDKYLLLIHLSEEEDHEYNINKALNPDLCIIAKQGGTYNLLGNLGSALLEVLDIVYERKEVVARDIAELLEKKLTLASTQLAKLNELRLVKRDEHLLEEGGRQFVYKSLF